MECGRLDQGRDIDRAPGLDTMIDRSNARAEEQDEQRVEPFGVPMDKIVSSTEAIVDGQKIILFGTNNYLGLTFDPDCIEAGVRALREQGTGTTGSSAESRTIRWTSAVSMPV